MWRSAVQLCLGLLVRFGCAPVAGGLAQLARAPALQAGGQRFESVILHFTRSVGNRSLACWTSKTVVDMKQGLHVLSAGPSRYARRIGKATWHDRPPRFFLGRGHGSDQGRMADALARGGDEGRGKLRKSTVRRKRPLTRGCPNGTTRPPEGRSSMTFRPWRRTGGTETS